MKKLLIVLSLFFLVAGCEPSGKATDVGNPTPEISQKPIAADDVWGAYEEVADSEEPDGLTHGTGTRCDSEPRANKKIERTENPGEMRLINFLALDETTQNFVATFDTGAFEFQMEKEGLDLNCDGTFIRLGGSLFLSFECLVNRGGEENCAIVFKHQ